MSTTEDELGRLAKDPTVVLMPPGFSELKPLETEPQRRKRFMSRWVQYLNLDVVTTITIMSMLAVALKMPIKQVRKDRKVIRKVLCGLVEEYYATPAE
tara:strand:- start:152 stop:445 length:294 start_codon:yes stop_codon:yes gene_type:complete